MHGLDFRKRRRRSSEGSGTYRVRTTRKKLRFEEKKAGFFPEREKWTTPDRMKDGILWAVEILIVSMAAVFLVAAFGQRVSIAGDSMAPVLKNGDVVLVNRILYRFTAPQRGDVIVFSQGGTRHYSTKRIVGLPGETIQIRDGQIWVDGAELPEYADVHGNVGYAGLAENPIELGEGEYFVMGDNHNASDDSRTPEMGSVAAGDIYGKVWFVAAPPKDVGWI